MLHATHRASAASLTQPRLLKAHYTTRLGKGQPPKLNVNPNPTSKTITILNISIDYTFVGAYKKSQLQNHYLHISEPPENSHGDRRMQLLLVVVVSISVVALVTIRFDS